jgi:hypothetical protein
VAAGADSGSVEQLLEMCVGLDTSHLARVGDVVEAQALELLATLAMSSMRPKRSPSSCANSARLAALAGLSAQSSECSEDIADDTGTLFAKDQETRGRP